MNRLFLNRIAVAATCAVAALLVNAPANAQVVITTTVFAGTLNETFESFPNIFDQPGIFLPDPTDIFGGAASLIGSRSGIYQPSAGANFAIGKGNAQVADGNKGLAVDGLNATRTIVFDGTVTQFGGFFNAAEYPNADDIVTFSFFDTSSALIDSETFDVDLANGTALNFFGFTSPTPIKTVTISGDFMAMDGLRANAAAVAVPEPGTLALCAVGFAGLIVRRKRTIA